MANQRLAMRKIRDVLRLSAQNLSQRKIEPRGPGADHDNVKEMFALHNAIYSARLLVCLAQEKRYFERHSRGV
jgi:hypothetical protein